MKEQHSLGSLIYDWKRKTFMILKFFWSLSDSINYHDTQLISKAVGTLTANPLRHLVTKPGAGVGPVAGQRHPWQHPSMRMSPCL